jgi:sporulation protein YlmC with PRC-barrel domain
MAQKDDLRAEWTGHDLYAADGEKIGTVEDVRYGDGTGELKWLVVEAGLLGTKTIFVPVLEVQRDGERLVVPYDKDQVMKAPKVENELMPTDDEKGGICTYFGLEFTPANIGPREDCVEPE